MENSDKNCNYWYQIELCTEFIQEAYEKYKKEKWESVHYNDGDFFDLVEKSPRVINFDNWVFLWAYQRFLENQEKIAFWNKLERIKKFLLQISNTLKKII